MLEIIEYLTIEKINKTKLNVGARKKNKMIQTIM